MGSRPRLSLLLVLVIGAGLPLRADAEAVSIPGTRVSLEPPPGFVLADQFPGVQNAELASSIMVNELPAPVDDLTAGFTAEGLASRGMTLRSSETASVSGRTGRLLSVTQIASGATFEKWMVAFGDASSTVLVVATFPQTLSTRLRAPLREAVLSATWAPDAKIDPFDGLPFRVQESEHLEFRNRLQNLILLAHPAQSPDNPSEPFLLVGSSHSPVRIDDLELFARQRITQTAQITNLRELRGTETKVANRPAYEIVAKANDIESGMDLTVYQVVLVEGATYYLMQGMVGASQAERYLPEFRQVVRSLEIR